MRRWHVVLAVVVAAQIVVPLVAALQPPPSRLAWQMYSGLGNVPNIAVEKADGSIEGLDIREFAARPRPELDWVSVLPAAICDKHPEAVRGTLYTIGGKVPFEC